MRKNDKDKNQSTPNPATLDESKTSMAKVLQRINKETENKEAAAEGAKTRCKTCFKEIAPNRRCGGHGGGGGGGGDDASKEKASSSDDKPLTQQQKVVKEMKERVERFGSMEDGEFESLADEKSFDPKIIAELIAKDILLVESDRESMTLTIQFKPELLTKEQLDKVQPEVNKYMKAVIDEFNDFKKEHNLSDECINITQDEKGNILSLNIKMPTLALYDAFIQRLANNLVPTPSPQVQKQHEDKREQSSAPTPLSMEPKPSDQKAEDEEQTQTTFNPTPYPKMTPGGK